MMSSSSETAGHPETSGSDLEALRRLLLASVNRRLDRVEARLESPDHLRSLLPEALLAARKGDVRLAGALAEALDGTLEKAVRRRSDSLLDHLKVLVGAVVGKAVREAIEQRLESFNRLLDHTLSLRALRWRWQAWRTGRSFAEVVFENTVFYETEEVFLIHQPTGLLIRHMDARPGRKGSRASVSGMLTAIEDFVRDSFGRGGQDHLDAFRVGDCQVLIEQKEGLTLAVVVHGQPPAEFRSRVSGCLDMILRHYAGEIRSFNGDAGAFVLVEYYLTSCVDGKVRPALEKVFPYHLVAIGLLAALVLVLVMGEALRSRRTADVYRFLENTPGVEVVQVGRRQIVALKDPSMGNVLPALEGFGFPPGEMHIRWIETPFSTPLCVLRKAKLLLPNDDGVRMQFGDGRLTLEGNASVQYVEMAERLPRLVPEVRAVDITRLRADGTKTLVRATSEIEETFICFDFDRADLNSHNISRLDKIAAQLGFLRRIAANSGMSVNLQVFGRADEIGDANYNDNLSAMRAQKVAEQLRRAGLPPEMIGVSPLGSRSPLRRPAPTVYENINRSATFKVTLSPLAGGIQ